MNEQRFENKIRQDVGKVKKDLMAIEEDSAAQMSEGFEKLKGDAKETVVGAVETVKERVGYGLSQYNAKVQEIADKVPGDLNEKVRKYPWVAMSIALVFGFFLGSLCKPGRQHHR